MSKRPTPPTRSLTEVPGWIKKTCERCGGEFWSVPSQAKFTRFCAKDCRHEEPLVRLLKNASTNEQGCLLFAGALTDGYGTIKYNGAQWRTHRLHWHLQVAPIPDGMDVLHRCIASRNCIRLNHLYVGIDEDNARDRIAQDRGAKGESHGNAVLNDEIVRHLKRLKGTMTCNEASKQTGINFHTIANIWSGDAWKHIVVDAPS